MPTERKRDDHGNLSCSFCGKSQKEVKKLIAGPTVYICDECIGLCNDIIAEEIEKESESFGLAPFPKPAEIKTVLDDYVIGQERAKKILAVAIHNHLVRERPDLAAALYEPLPYDTRGEHADGARAYYSVPAFTEHDGRLFVRFIPQYILASQRHADAPALSATAREAIAAASALANDPDFNVYMDLQPGEIQLINNYHVLHGRTAYEDDVAHGYKRHLKRLWLATHALVERPSYFAALGRRSHWEQRRSVSTVKPVVPAAPAAPAPVTSADGGS